MAQGGDTYRVYLRPVDAAVVAAVERGRPPRLRLLAHCEGLLRRLRRGWHGQGCESGEDEVEVVARGLDDKMEVALARRFACRCQLKSLIHTQKWKGGKRANAPKAPGSFSARCLFFFSLMFVSTLPRLLVAASGVGQGALEMRVCVGDKMRLRSAWLAGRVTAANLQQKMCVRYNNACFCRGEGVRRWRLRFAAIAANRRTGHDKICRSWLRAGLRKKKTIWLKQGHELFEALVPGLGGWSKGQASETCPALV